MSYLGVPEHFVKMQLKPVILSIFSNLGVFFISCVYFLLTNFYHVSSIAFCQCEVIELPKQPYLEFSSQNHFCVMRSLLCLPSRMFCCISSSVVGLWKGYINLKRSRRRNCENSAGFFVSLLSSLIKICIHYFVLN